MAFTDFTLDTIRISFGIVIRQDLILTIDTERYYINELETILGALQATIHEFLPVKHA